MPNAIAIPVAIFRALIYITSLKPKKAPVVSCSPSIMHASWSAGCNKSAKLSSTAPGLNFTKLTTINQHQPPKNFNYFCNFLMKPFKKSPLKPSNIFSYFATKLQKRTKVLRELEGFFVKNPSNFHLLKSTQKFTGNPSNRLHFNIALTFLFYARGGG